MFKKGPFVLFLFGFQLLSCVSNPVTKPDKVDRKTEPAPLITKESKDKTVPNEYGDGDPDCIPLADELQALPQYVSDTGALIANFLDSCKTPKGLNGIKKGSPWTALGFPCTGGEGDYDWKGSQYAPKLVQFKFTNSCPMLIGSQDTLESELKSSLPIPENTKLIAYYPFTVIYWEVPAYGDADTGYILELFSNLSRSEGWNHFQSGQKLYIKLFGRENTLVKTPNLYEVDGYIKREGEHQFRLFVDSVRLLDESAVKITMEKCRRLKPRRNCDQFF